jgi:carbon storage regulator
MLVLSRKNNESVVIGGSGGFERLVKLTVIRVRGGSVKLGFEVPGDVPVHRWEVWERIRDRSLPAVAACTDTPRAAPL